MDAGRAKLDIMSTIKPIWSRYQTFLRYAVVGVLGTLVDLGVLYLLTEWSQIDPHKSQIFPVFVGLAFIAAVLHNYVLNRIWTFKSQDSQISAQFFRFLVVSAGGFLLTQALMWLLVAQAAIWYLLAKALTSLIVLSWNFGLNKMWTFRSTSPVTCSSVLSP